MSNAQRYIDKARLYFNQLEKSSDPEFEMETVRRALNDAGATAAVLDPEGKKSAADMEREIATRLRAAVIRAGRQTLAYLQGEGTFDYVNPAAMAQETLDALHRMGTDASALDPDGKKTAAEMERILDKAMKSAISRQPETSYAKTFRQFFENIFIGIARKTLSPEEKVTAFRARAGVEATRMAASIKESNLAGENDIPAIVGTIMVQGVTNAIEKNGGLREESQLASAGSGSIMRRLSGANSSDAALLELFTRFSAPPVEKTIGPSSFRSKR